MGAGFRHSYRKFYYEDNSLDYKGENNSYSIFPYIKKYLSLGNSVAFSIRGEARYTHSDYKSDDYDSTVINSDNDSDTDEFFIGVRPGLSLFVTKKILLKASFGSLGYSTRKFKRHNEDNPYESKSKRLNFSFNNTQLVAGLTFLL